MNFLNKILKSFLGNKNELDIREAKKYLEKIKEFELKISALSHDELRLKTLAFKAYLNKRIKKISDHITSLQNQVYLEEDIDLKEKLYEDIDIYKKKPL